MFDVGDGIVPGQHDTHPACVSCSIAAAVASVPFAPRSFRLYRPTRMLSAEADLLGTTGGTLKVTQMPITSWAARVPSFAEA